MGARIDTLRTRERGTPEESRDRLNSLVLSGTKRATAELLDIDYRAESEDLSHVGECLVVVDSAETEVTAVDIVPFYEATGEFADAEGEDFHSIQHWRKTTSATGRVPASKSTKTPRSSA
jgi:uncharacterized protein YhfF